jgi:hypothetical protein
MQPALRFIVSWDWFWQILFETFSNPRLQIFAGIMYQTGEKLQIM